MATTKPRIGMLTSGGDCPGLNAVIRAAVKTAGRLGYECLGFLRGFEGLVDPVSTMPLDARNTADILAEGGTILGSSNRGRFAAKVGTDQRVTVDPALLNEAAATLRDLSVSGLIVIGGDGSLTMAQEFFEHGMPVIGVPKTIDNDLRATAFTFGFDSAVATATDALDKLRPTAASHERIMVLEVMGRNTGWIALHAGIAGGGDVILIPEIPWSFEYVCRKVLEREAMGRRFTLIVVAEGAPLPSGDLVIAQNAGRGQVKLGGIGQVIADELARRLDRETRAVVLGHLQRGGEPTTFDRVLATELGAHAVKLVHRGEFGRMVCFQPPEIGSVPITEAVKSLSHVDPRGSAVQAARAIGIGFGDAADEVSPFAR